MSEVAARLTARLDALCRGRSVAEQDEAFGCLRLEMLQCRRDGSLDQARAFIAEGRQAREADGQRDSFEALALELATGLLLEEMSREAKALSVLEPVAAARPSPPEDTTTAQLEHLQACALLCCALASHRILRVSDTRRYADRALNLANKLRCARMQAEALVYAGLAYLDGQQLGAARQTLEEALRVAGECDGRSELATAKDALGQVDAARGDLFSALANFSEALVLYDELDDEDGQAMVLRHSGSAYLKMGDAPRALTFHQQSLRLTEKTHDIRGQLIAHSNICRAHMKSGDLRQARKALTESMRLDLHVKNEIAAGYMNLLEAELSCASGRFTKAAEHAEIGRGVFAEHGDQYHTALTHAVWGQANAGMKNFGGAREQFHQATFTLRQLGANADLAEALLQAGQMHIARDDIPAAVECLLGAIETAEEVHLHGLTEQCKAIIERVPAERWARVLTDLSLRHQELVRLTQFREDMAHHLTHDLRSPLGNVRTALEGVLAEREDLKPPHARILGEALASCSILLSRIATVLDVYKMERTEVPLVIEMVNLDEVVDQAWGLISPSADARLEFASHIAADVPPIGADREKLQRVLENLLANAAKYAGHGADEAPRVQVSATYHGEAQTVVVCVEDNGPGVPEDVRDRIFERFGTTGGAYQRPGSLGLGLHFAKMAVDAHGGRIWVDSCEGRGSRFAFELPLT